MKKRFTICLLFPFIWGSAIADTVFVGKKGLVIMEAESTNSSLKKWKKKEGIEGYTGEAHLEFTGNKPAQGPAHSPLTYHFKVDKEGDYSLLIRANKRLEDQPEDRCNDCYVRLEGDFSATNNKRGAPLEFLKTDTKLFGGKAEGWGWTARLDRDHKKYQPLYRLKPDVVYTLTISGRSQRFNMDRIIFHHSSVKAARAKDSKEVESSRVALK